MRGPTVAAATLALFAACLVLAQQNSVTATGFITDTLCGAKGATANHVAHAKTTVASGKEAEITQVSAKAKYAIYDEETKQLYILDPQESAVAYLGQRVTITGTVKAAAVRRAGQTLDNASQQAVSHTPRAGAPLDTSTPVAGVLRISSITVEPLVKTTPD